MTSVRVKIYKAARTRQHARYAALSRDLDALAQLPDTFLSPDHQDYQAVIAENVSELRA